jgi:hypothetical protein
MQSSPLAFLSHSTVISLHMNVPDCNYRRNNNAQRQASGGPESSLDLSPFPPSDMPTLWRRRKSRSPDSKTSQRSIPSQKSDASNIIKRKKSGTSMAHAPEADVTIVDRGRRIKSKSTITLTSRLNVSTENTATTSGSVNRSSHPVANKKEKEKVRAKEKEKEKEHSKSRDTHVPSRNHVPSQPAVSDKKADSQDGFQPECSGPLAMAEFKRMQKEIDSLKKVR